LLPPTAGTPAILPSSLRNRRLQANRAHALGHVAIVAKVGSANESLIYHAKLAAIIHVQSSAISKYSCLQGKKQPDEAPNDHLGRAYSTLVQVVVCRISLRCLLFRLWMFRRTFVCLTRPSDLFTFIPSARILCDYVADQTSRSATVCWLVRLAVPGRVPHGDAHHHGADLSPQRRAGSALPGPTEPLLNPRSVHRLTHPARRAYSAVLTIRPLEKAFSRNTDPLCCLPCIRTRSSLSLSPVDLVEAALAASRGGLKLNALSVYAARVPPRRLAPTSDSDRACHSPLQTGIPIALRLDRDRKGGHDRRPRICAGAAVDLYSHAQRAPDCLRACS